MTAEPRLGCDETRVKARLIEAAVPHLIDRAHALMDEVGRWYCSRGAVAYALACCGGDPQIVADLRARWLKSSSEDSFLIFVVKERRAHAEAQTDR